MTTLTHELWGKILLMWQHRKCFICCQLGRCNHREPAVELAYIEQAQRLGNVVR